MFVLSWCQLRSLVPECAADGEPAMWRSSCREENTLLFQRVILEMRAEGDFPSPRPSLPSSFPGFPIIPEQQVAVSREQEFLYPGRLDGVSQVLPWDQRKAANRLFICSRIHLIYTKESLRPVAASTCILEIASANKECAQLSFSWVCAA